ncbi:unnamed protein product [Ceutorhynchus assimilis]|uniref:TsaA-like domain-containing protein n=1 Tax=Ceutorhynchus assimilis TaxID=467358 RepID=A0A9N9MPP4_9CUCU|nr:unnamed protein product [Ceutorhynchus assimilis]
MNSSEDDVNKLQKELIKARQELHNIRTQLKSLQHIHGKDINKITKTLEEWQSGDYNKCELSSEPSSSKPCKDKEITFKPIGIIHSEFPRIRGTPRQPTITINDTTARLTINKDIFTNPSHSLQDLNQFSHMWIIFVFHENSTHPKAKVSPPRLDGTKTGVFATRSPHRPCPIGLSLVKIEKIVDNVVYFNGVDMIDQTPVLDIKPYIPQYDQPNMRNIDEHENLAINDSDEEALEFQVTETPTPDENLEGRGAPDGEENGTEASAVPSAKDIKVPSWIEKAPVTKLSVVFEEEALVQLRKIEPESASESCRLISKVLQEDPRSIYLRKKWRGAPYKWRIKNLTLTCIFNNEDHTVKIMNICQDGNIE